MASLYRRLHGIFTNASLPSTRTSLPSVRTLPPPPPSKPTPLPSSRIPLPSPPTPTPTAPQPKPKDRRKLSMNEMFRERKLRSLVDKFRKSSEAAWFRGRHAIYFETVRRLAAAKKFTWIEEILEDQKRYKTITDEGFAIRIMCLYGKSGMFEHAHKLFDEMPHLNCDRTVRSFNALLAACLHSKKFDKIEEIFREVPRNLSIVPDVVSYNTVVKAFCAMGSLDSALLAVDEMERNGVNPNNITCNTILDELYRNGRLSDAENVWKLMEAKGVLPCIKSYNAKLQGLISQNRILEAMDLFEGLGAKELKPDVSTFNTLIKGFCDGGDLEQAKKWYKELTKTDCVPTRMTYKILVPFVCEMGDFRWGLKLCNEAITRQFVLDAETLQGVVDGLVKESQVEEARKLVEFVGTSKGYTLCKLKLPLDQ